MIDENERARRALEKKRLQGAEKGVASALQAVGKAACRTETHTKIPLRVINENPEDLLLADLIVGKLKNLGFGVYFRDRGAKKRIREYCVSWVKNITEIPEGFKPVE